MDDAERNYWKNTLPIMTSEQKINLKEILVNGREALEGIDQKYLEATKRVSQQK